MPKNDETDDDRGAFETESDGAAAATAIELGLTRSANFAGCRYRRNLSMSRKRTDEPDSSQGGPNKGQRL